MRLRDLPGWLRDTALRAFPHATRPGLRRIGAPGPNDPVLLTCNFTLTVRRITQVMAGRSAWLLVANSGGINVWCAAGGGHLTDRDVIAVLRSSGIDAEVTHRRLILPQLAATGIQRRRVTEATGWDTAWGPARLEDLPEFLDHGARAAKRMRPMRFPAWERAEMGLMWGLPLLVPAGLAIGLPAGALAAAVGVALLLGTVEALFLAVPLLPVGRPAARGAICLAFAAACFAGGSGVLRSLGALTPAAAISLAVVTALVYAMLSLDLTGSTPWWPSGINTLGNRFAVELVEDRCRGFADCVLVCPRSVLAMNGRRRKVEIAAPERCIRCGACIVQCPAEALRFRFRDGRLVEASQVRRTRLNLLGRRTGELRERPPENP